MIQIEEQGNGVLFNGALTDKQGWVLSPSSDQTKVVLTNRITGLSGSSDVTEVEVDGSTFADYDALVAALGSVLFKNGGGTGEGVQSVTGDGVDNTDPENPTISYPTPADIAAATAAQGSIAETAVQPGDLSEVAISGDYTDLNGIPSTFTPSAHTHAAADVTSGTFDAARIPNLNASKINAGTLADARIPSLAISKITGLQGDLDNKVNSSDIPQEVQDWLLTLTGATTAGNVLAVNSGGDGFEFITPA